MWPRHLHPATQRIGHFDLETVVVRHVIYYVTICNHRNISCNLPRTRKISGFSFNKNARVTLPVIPLCSCFMQYTHKLLQRSWAVWCNYDFHIIYNRDSYNQKQGFQIIIITTKCSSNKKKNGFYETSYYTRRPPRSISYATFKQQTL